jgi:hypothetical protein
MIYLESANASSFDNCTIENLDIAFQELQQSDEEHGAFWVVDEDENVLEINKDLVLFAIFSEDSENQIRKQLNDINQVKGLFIEFINRNIERLKIQIENL